MDVKEELEKVIRATVPTLSIDKITLLIDHLISDDVGVSSPSLITHITEEDILYLGKVPKRALLQAFQNYGTSNRLERDPEQRATPANDSVQNPGSSIGILDQQPGPSGSSESLRNRRQNPIRQSCPTFIFHIDWELVPLTLVRSLNKAESERNPAHPEDKRILKLEVAKQLVASYQIYSELNPSVKFKTPGLNVYEAARDEVFEVYKFCLQDFINNEAKADGKDTFLTVLKICVDNKCRPIKKTPRPMKRAVHGRGVVGVLSQQVYEPVLLEEEETEQLNMKEALKEMHKNRKTHWNIPAINRNMHNSYALQRKEIVEVLKKIKEKQTGDNDDPSVLEDNDGIYPYIEHLQQEWPFLFEYEWLQIHFQLLMGHLLDLPMREYVNHHIDNMITYLTSSSSTSTVKNIAIQRSWQANGNNPSLKLLVAICMISNYFKEDFKVFIKTAEKTTRYDEVKWAVEDLTGDPCIVVLDNNMYAATKCLPCIDQVALTSEPLDFEDGLMQLFASIFMLDAEYPDKVPHTMEFLERVVFGLAVDKSRLPRKKTITPVLLLSPTVARLVNNARTFIEELQKLMP